MILKRRNAVSEVVAVALILAAMTAVLGVALVTSNDQILSHKASASDAIDRAKQRVGELVVLVHVEKGSNAMKVTLFNYGREDIAIDKVMVDGNQMAFAVKSPEGANLGKVPSKQPAIIEVNRVGSTVQMITGSGNLFEFLT